MFALRNLARRPARTSLTVAGVAIGVASVVTMLAVVRGFRTQFESLFAAGDAHLVLTRRDASDPFLSYLPAPLAAGVAARPEVRSAHPLLLSVAQVGASPLFPVYGTTAGSPFLSQVRLVEGEDPFAEGARPGGLLLGRRAAGHLGVGVGGRLALGGGVHEIRGLFESGTPLLAAGAVLPLEDAQRATGLEGKVSSILVRLRSPDPGGAAAAALEAAFPAIEASRPGLLTEAFDEFRLMDRAAALLTALALVLGGLGVMNTMLMCVFERTAEVGILRAVGWSRSMVLGEFLREGVLLCAAGGAAGIGAGALALAALGRIEGLSWVAGDLGPGILLLSLAVACGMGLLGAAWPSWRAASTDPVEALRR